MKDIEIRDVKEKVIFSGEVEDIKSINDTQYRIWFKSPSGILLNESISKDQVIVFSA